MIFVFAMLFVVGCDFNPLGGSKSHLDPLFEPGKHVASAPPTISAIADFIIDENDVQTIPFTINDPDTFMVCSLVFVKATSTNNTIIDSSGLTVGGTYPNCTLTIAPKAFQFGVVNITVSVYDFWTYARSTFQLDVRHILAPGAFSITDATGGNQFIDVTWQNAPYMLTTGAYTSPYYSIYYREAYTSNPFIETTRVTSPYTINGLVNGTEYEIYVIARNSIGQRQSNTVIAEPTRFQNRGAQFISGSNQAETTTAVAALNPQYVNFSLLPEVPDTDSNYPLLSYDLSENPVDDPSPTALPGSSITTPSGNYKVYMNSQSTILSGVGQ